MTFYDARIDEWCRDLFKSRYQLGGAIIQSCTPCIETPFRKRFIPAKCCYAFATGYMASQTIMLCGLF